MKIFLSIALTLSLLFTSNTEPATLSLSTPSAILMEKETGTVLYEKNSHEKMRPASITKIMTMILIFEALEKGRYQMQDEVTVSEHAAGMGGSQVYLEAGEIQTVESMLKCISICSANDACVAMAEFTDGSEEAFVENMNRKAVSLGMKDTHFVNCCGLEAEGHLTSAYDIALMSRELITKYPQVHDYCTIWMDEITHNTKRGSSVFGLTNTNKLLRYYSYTTGLKTGFTSLAGYCISVTAKKDDVSLIAVVMKEENTKIRNKDAIALLNYGFAHCSVYKDPLSDPLPLIPVKRGNAPTVPIAYDSPFQYVLTDGSFQEDIHKEIHLPDSVTAPVQKGDPVGSVVYSLDGKEIGRIEITAADSVLAAGFPDCLKALFSLFLLQ